MAAMHAAKACLLAESLEGALGLHAQITGVGAYVAGDEARALEGADIAVFDGGDIGRADAKLPLHVQQRLAKRRPLAAHQVAQRHVEHVISVEIVL
ncbi:MAG: hypothetical protein HLUCCO18_17745 [Rhodobacteraceae bacterium HLUCCO18]|nr:MAG: hypothetical protein HLUCCO18_17745 [Rhodobacteraceae bacterium HLUCCO18]